MTKNAVFPKLSNRTALNIVLLLLTTMPAPIVYAQQEFQPAAERADISRSRLEKLKHDIERNTALDGEIREEILKHYDEAIKALSEANRFSALASRYQRDQAAAPRLIESLEAQLQGESPDRAIRVPDAATAADVQQLLQQAGAELTARREAVQSIKKSTDQRNARKTEISRRAALLDQQIYELDSSIESAIETVSEPLLREATLAGLAARRTAARQELRALSEELTNLNLRNSLRLLREQRAERRVADALRRMKQLEEILRSKVETEIEKNLSRLRQETAEALERYPRLNILTDEILQIADRLFGPEGVEKRAEPLTARLNDLREARAKVARAMEVARSKYTALGDRADLQRWYPVLPPEVPSRNELKFQISQLSFSLADAKATLVGLQDRRANLTDLDRELSSLSASLGPAEDANEAEERQSLSRRLMLTRTELLDLLVSQYGNYHSKLSEVDEASRNLLEELELGYQFILDRIFWRRSVSGPLLPPLGNFVNAVRWLFVNPDWPASAYRSLRGLYERPGPFIGWLVLLILLAGCRRRIKQRLIRAGKLANESAKPLRPLLESVLWTIALAAPLPLAIAGLGFFLKSPQPAEVAEKVGIALTHTALLSLGLELILQVFRTGGFAEIHFAMSTAHCHKIYREVQRLMWVVLPAAMIFMSFGREASDHAGDPSRIANLESLGRLAFIVAALAIAFMSLHLAKWLSRQGSGISIRFPSSVLAVLGTACLSAALLSVFGWHLGAFVLAMLLLRSFFLILDVALVAAFFERLRQIRERLLRESESGKRSNQDSGTGEESEEALSPAENIDFESTNRKVGELIRLGAIVITLMGLYLIWSAQIPSLRYLERVQLLPRAEILPMEQIAPADVAPPRKPVAAPPSASISPTMISNIPSQKPDEQAGSGYSLTLAGLLGAIGILLILVVLAKYLPSLLDFAVLSRFRIVSGDRKAITTIVSYILVLVGLSAAAAKMGLRWSQVQWLAAAFSFGLGFGLQDIFANFFSGLVLLFERPMRVGDFCRFGDQVGTVEAIGLRSTKVRGLDRTVINVPNADFSKKELVNYAKRDRMLLKTTIALRYETSDEQLRYVLARIRELLLSHPKIAEDPARARFVGYGDFSLNIEIFAYGIADNWGEFLGIQEDVLLRIKQIVEESGTGFAFPSQTTYLSRDEGLDAERTAAAEAQVQAWRSEHKLPFPEFSERQRGQFRNSLDYPPAGSPYTGLAAGQKGISKTGNDPKT